VDLSLTQIRGFVALARYLNFRRAADELRITQPALSAQIKGLEKDLGVALLTRTTRTVRLTPDGERFLPRARLLLDAVRCTLAEMSGGSNLEHGTLSFSCIPTIAAHAFPQIIREFQRHHPGVRVEMSDDETVNMERRIVNREVEFGIGGRPRSMDQLDFAPILEDPFVLLCRKDHPLAKRSKVAVKQVLKFPIVTLGRGSNVRNTLNTYFSRRGLLFEPEYEVIHHYSLGAMVEAKLGISLLPSMACNMIRGSPNLRVITLDDDKFTRSVGLIKRRGEALSPVAHRFYALGARAMQSKGRRAPPHGPAAITTLRLGSR